MHILSGLSEHIAHSFYVRDEYWTPSPSLAPSGCG